jgi:putative aldouronate transport system permease protein
MVKRGLMGMFQGRRSDEPLFDAVIYLISLVVLIVVLYPLIYVLSASFSNPALVIEGQVYLLPKEFTLEAYSRVFMDQTILIGYKNTIIYTVVGTLVNLILTVLAAYPLSRKDLPGRNLFMFYIAFTMFFSGGLIPSYLLIKQLNLIDNFWVMVLPTAISTYNLIVMRTYFQNTIPMEIQESAFIDGCNNFRLLWSIVLPLSKPILAVILLFYAVGHWNAFFNAMIYLRDENKYPLQLIIRGILLQNQFDGMGTDTIGLQDRVLLSEGIKYAVIIVSSIPVLLLYPFVQRYFIKGIMIGAIKG